MRTTRKLVLFLLVGTLVAVAPSARLSAGAPLRSGTILSGVGSSPGNFWVHGVEGCVSAPTCSAWLQGFCRPALAGKNPALHAAIVDVGKLSDGVTERLLSVQDGLGINWGRFTVQFWTKSGPALYDYCSEILESRLTVYRWDMGCNYSACTFRIPADAKWMTITSRTDNTNVNWQLW